MLKFANNKRLGTARVAAHLSCLACSAAFDAFAVSSCSGVVQYILQEARSDRSEHKKIRVRVGRVEGTNGPRTVYKPFCLVYLAGTQLNTATPPRLFLLVTKSAYGLLNSCDTQTRARQRLRRIISKRNRRANSSRDT